MLNEVRELEGEDLEKVFVERIADEVGLGFVKAADVVQCWGGRV